MHLNIIKTKLNPKELEVVKETKQIRIDCDRCFVVI